MKVFSWAPTPFAYASVVLDFAECKYFLECICHVIAEYTIYWYLLAMTLLKLQVSSSVFHADLYIKLNTLALSVSNYNPLCEIHHNFKQSNLDSNNQVQKQSTQFNLVPFLFRKF